MIYSVWNQGARAYDYFDAPETEPARANAPKPLHMRSRTLGAVIEQAAWPLPSGSIPVGSGPRARGRIAMMKRGGRAGLGDFQSGSGIALLALLLGGLGLATIMSGKKGRGR